MLAPGMRLLVIENDLSLAETLRALIEEAPDAALLDIVLPKLSGLALLERLN